MVLIEMGDCLPGGSSGLLIEASREEMRDFAKGSNLLYKKVVVVADGDTTDAEAWELYRRMLALMGRPVDTGIKEHAQLGNQPTLEVKP